MITTNIFVVTESVIQRLPVSRSLCCYALACEPNLATILWGFRAHGGFETNASIGMSVVGQIWLQLISLVVTESVIQRPPVFRSICCYALALRSNLATIFRDFRARIWSMKFLIGWHCSVIGNLEPFIHGERKPYARCGDLPTADMWAVQICTIGNTVVIQSGLAVRH